MDSTTAGAAIADVVFAMDATGSGVAVETADVA